MEIMNTTIRSDFILKGFSGSPTTYIVLFVILFLVFLATLCGNILLIAIICYDYRLHVPMYLFLVCLSFIDICIISTIIPQLLAILIAEEGTISKKQCFTQAYIYLFTCSSEFLLLGIMSFDRFLAIRYPLQYTSTMKKSLCIQLVVGCFIISFSCLMYPTVTISKIPFCGYVIDHFFCESAAMMKLVCADTSLLKLNEIIAAVFVLIGSLTVTTMSYILIVATVVRIPSDTGRQKTFSTCMSHLIVISIVFGSAIFIKIRPSKDYSIEKDKIVNLVSSVLAPLLNPFIYTLRNQKVKECIREAMRRNRLINQQ